MSNATEFKTACVLQNSIEELKDALDCEADQLDCEAWQITPDEWSQAVRGALAEKLAEAD